MSDQLRELLRRLGAAGANGGAPNVANFEAAHVRRALRDSPEAWSTFYATAATHRSAAVRLAALECVEAGLGEREDRSQLVCWLIHDSNDVVAMRAGVAAAREPFEDAIAELFSALGGTASALSRHVYARSDLRQDLLTVALTTLLDHVDDDDSHRAHLLRTGYDAAADASSHRQIDPLMVPVPGTTLLIDPAPVSANQYDAFVRLVDHDGHAWCHWGEPAEFDHMPAATPRDGESAVTGISWFDAFAFSRWAGKRLPTSSEWQQASVVLDTAGTSAKPPPPFVSASLEELQMQLDQLADYDADPLRPWEWTATRHLDGTEINPFVGRRDHYRTVGDWTLYAVTHGGHVRSHGQEAGPSYRGRKHVLHKSPEMTFRCATERLSA